MSDNVKVQKLRFEFEKIGKMRFISHLDLLRVMQRVMGRAEVPLWHSEGFNPHPYIAFGQPLSLGQEGYRELMDASLTEKCGDPALLCKKINGFCPEGLRVLRAYEPIRPIREIAMGKYESILYGYSENDIPNMKSRLEGNTCIVQKKNGKTFVPFDILPYARKVELKPTENGVLVCSVLDCAPSRVLNVTYLTEGLTGTKDHEVLHKRLCLLDKDGNVF